MPQVKEERPSYVRFEKRPIEDRGLSIANGHFTSVDVEYAIITPHGTSDEIPRKVDEWFPYLKEQVRTARLPQRFFDYYQDAYNAWKKGEDMPLNGTPIKEWPVLSPAQVQNCIAARVYTVEDLAAANEETIRVIGMGARELKQKAENWLRSATEQGKMTEEISTLQTENKRMAAAIKRQQETIDSLRNEVQSLLETRGNVTNAQPETS